MAHHQFGAFNRRLLQQAANPVDLAAREFTMDVAILPGGAHCHNINIAELRSNQAVVVKICWKILVIAPVEGEEALPGAPQGLS